MMHPFMELDDGTVVVHSDLQGNGEREEVKVYFEKPTLMGFKSAYCVLPEYKWEDIEGFDKEEIDKLQDFIESTAHLIIRFARQGGIGHAANF